MTPTQIARRSDALYADGTCGMTRRVLCDMVAQREADLEDARTENTRLRELARNALTYIAYSGCGLDPYEGPTGMNRLCEDCRHFDTDSCAYVIARCASELGIEVD